MLKSIANIITSFRIFCSVLLLFFSVFSMEFYITYLLCGFSDMIDGTIARKTNSNSAFGAKFDTVADLVFIAVAFIKLLPIIHIPKWLWTWIIIIGIMKNSNIVLGYTRNKKFISLHTIMNKITGLLLFLLPLTVSIIELKSSSTIVCSIATFSAIQEDYYISTERAFV